MRYVLAVFVAATACQPRPGPITQTPSPVATAITGVTLFDGTGAPPSRNMTVVVVGDRIAAIGPTGTIHVPPTAKIVDGRGRFLIPGLWDMHVHLALTGNSALSVLVVNGVTSVRDMGGDAVLLAAWREAIDSGRLLGPRIRFAGPPLESAKWLARVQQIRLPGFEFPNPAWRLNPPIGVSDERTAALAVDSVARLGADFIKVRTVESREAYFAIARAATAHHLMLVGHSPTPIVTLAEASDSGQRSIEHLDFREDLDRLSETQRQAEYRLFVRNGTWFDPTLTSDAVQLSPDSMLDRTLRAERESDRRGSLPELHYLSSFMLESFRRDLFVQSLNPPDTTQLRNWRTNLAYLRAMHAAGVRFLIGTDLGALWIFPGSSVHDELALFVQQLGFSPAEALRAATHDAAEFSGQLDRLGTIAPGKQADLILLNADPLVDIANTRRIAAVLVRGRLLDRTALDAIADSVRTQLAAPGH